MGFIQDTLGNQNTLTSSILLLLISHASPPIHLDCLTLTSVCYFRIIRLYL